MTYERGEARLKAARDARARYDAGTSITAIAADLGRSYGHTRGLLADAGTEFRPRGQTRRTGVTA